MRGNVFTIIKKELSRFFKDPRLVITTLIIPGLMIYVMYSFMGDGLTTQFTTPEEYIYRVDAVNPSILVSEYLKKNVGYVNMTEVSDQNVGMERLNNDMTDLLIVFPEEFDTNINKVSKDVPNVDVYYNSSQIASSEAYTIILIILDYFESSISN